MTRQRDLKARIRARMKKTGERYTSARAQILQQSSTQKATAHFPGVLDGYDRFGGVQGETAILQNVLRHSGVTHSANGMPYSEAMLHGLCGGIGFMYAVFEYKGWPPMLTMVMRSGTMPDTYMMPVFDRIGVTIKSEQTTSANRARQHLDEALDAGKPAICVVDIAHLPYYGVPSQMAGMGPHYVAVVGRDGNDFWLDDRSPRPCRVSADQLALARDGYKKAKHHLITIETHDPKFDWKASLYDAIGATCRALEDGDVGVPPNFRSNCGFAGMEKWQRLLTDAKDKKGWSTVFNTPDKAYVGLRRAYECIQYEYTAPAGGRLFYAEFLDESAGLTGDTKLSKAAEHWRDAADGWSALAGLIADAPDDAIQKGCQLCDQRAELLDQDADAATDELQRLAEAQRNLKDDCQLTPESAVKVFDAMADRLDDIIAIERRAVEALRATQ